MDTETIVGLAIGFAALSLLSYLTLWSRRTIERINNNDSPRSARYITRELRGDR